MPLWGKSLLHKNWMEESLGKAKLRCKKQKLKQIYKSNGYFSIPFSQVHNFYLDFN